MTNMDTLFVLIVFVFAVIQTCECLRCHTCVGAQDEITCMRNITTCSPTQSCHKSIDTVNGITTMTLGCRDNQQCSGQAVISSIVGRDLTTRQTESCTECCSADLCNLQLCYHLKPSTCIDDFTVDCARMSSIFSICNDIHHAKNVCPKFCNLCDLIDGEWSIWSSWSQCAVTCGNGTQTRKRSCSNPSPEHGGLECAGASYDVKACDTSKICPNNQYANCYDIKQHNPFVLTGIYDVVLWNTSRKIQVYCDMTTEGGGWTVFSNYIYRVQSSFIINPSTTEMENGYGNLHSSFWLGYDYMHEMTSEFVNEVRLDLVFKNGTTVYGVASPFTMSSTYDVDVGNITRSNNKDISGDPKDIDTSLLDYTKLTQLRVSFRPIQA